jgi:PKD repeat protein
MVRADPTQLLSPPYTGTLSYAFYQNERTRATNASFYHTESENALALEVDFNGVKDITRVEFNSSATAGFDGEYDANKYDGDQGRPTLYSHSSSMWYSINVQPKLTQVTTVPVGLRPEASGTMTISPQGISSFDPTTYIILEDKKTNIFHDLRAGAYTFTTDVSDNQERFVLHFTPPMQVAIAEASCTVKGSIKLTQPGTANWNYVITNNQNTVISSGVINQNNAVMVNAVAGVYTVTLNDNNGYSVVKTLQIGGDNAVTADFTASATVAPVNGNITFANNTPNATDFTWEFSDGTIITGVQNPTYAFSEPGNYAVTLTVINSDGCTSSVTKTITVTTSTGLSSLIANRGIGMWSNENVVYVDFSSQPKVDAEIDIYNILGQ